MLWLGTHWQLSLKVPLADKYHQKEIVETSQAGMLCVWLFRLLPATVGTKEHPPVLSSVHLWVDPCKDGPL